MPAQGGGPPRVSPACPFLPAVSPPLPPPPPRAGQHHLCALARSPLLRQLLKHNQASSTSGLSAALNRGCLCHQWRDPATPCPQPPSTEFPGFVLSALAMENLCCVCGGPGLCCTSFSTPDSPVPSLFWWSWGFAAPQSHNTAKKSVCVPVGGGGGVGGSPRPSGVWFCLGLSFL